MNAGTMAIILGLAALVSLLISLSTILKILVIRRTPTTWISALTSEGRAEVVGKASPKTLESPINKKPCVLWQVEVQQERSGYRGRTWNTVLKKTSGEPFVIEDETGKILIKPEGANLILSDDTFSDQLDEQTQHLLSTMGVSTTSWLGFKKRLRYYERLIAPQKEVFVTGMLTQDGGSWSIAHRTGAPLIISDRSEHELLKTLYLRVATYFGILFAIAIGIIIVIAAE